MAYMFFDALSKPSSWTNWSLENMDGEEESLSVALQNLRENGLRHHMSKGLVNQYLQEVSLEESSPYLSVHRVSVLRPIIQMDDMIILYIEDVRQMLLFRWKLFLDLVFLRVLL